MLILTMTLSALYPHKSFDCSIHFAHTSLVWLEEQTVHIGQLNFVVIKEQQLK